MALPSKYTSPSKGASYEMPKIPKPSGPSTSSSTSTHSTTSSSSHSSSGSMSTDWKSTNDIRRQQLQVKHGLSADDAHDMTDIPYSEPDDDSDHSPKAKKKGK
jgi:hypothetical protein